MKLTRFILPLLLGVLVACSEQSSSDNIDVSSQQQNKQADKKEDATPEQEGTVGIVTKTEGTQLPSSGEVDFALASHPAPEFAWRTAGGEAKSLKDLRGKVVLVNFWGTWCPPCRMELPDLVSIYQEHREKGLEIVGVSIGDEPYAEQSGLSVANYLQQFATANGLAYPMVVATDDLRRLYGGIESVPSTFVINRDGQVVNLLIGAKSKVEFESAIVPLL